MKNKVVIILFVLALAFVFNIFQKPVRGFFYSISSPFQSFLWGKGSGVSDFFSSFFHGASLKESENQLQAERDSLLAKLENFKDVEKENEQLRQALSLGLRERFRFVSAEIIGKEPAEDIIIINKGKKDGISEGMAVITPSNVAAGKIVEVFDSISKVLLVSNAKSSVEAKIQTKGILGVMKGKGRSQMLFNLVPKDKDLAQGDVVVTTSLGGVFPENLLLGMVQEVVKNDVEPFQGALVKPFFELGANEVLFVITGK